MAEPRLIIPAITSRTVYGYETPERTLHLSHGNILTDTALLEFENPVTALRYAEEGGLEVVWE